MNLEDAPLEALQSEIQKRIVQQRRAKVAARVRLAELLQEAFTKVPGLQALLVPNPAGELHTAIFQNSYDYEVKLNSFYDPLEDK